MILHMGELQKITVTVPSSLLKTATDATGKGVTETVRTALADLAHREACRRIRSMRGKVKLDIDLKALRED